MGGRRVATNTANFTKGDVVGVVLDADQGEIVFLRNGVEQGRARGIRGRLYPFVSFDSEGDQITLLGEGVGLARCWFAYPWLAWRRSVALGVLQGRLPPAPIHPPPAGAPQPTPLPYATTHTRRLIHAAAQPHAAHAG